jgi:hypothetical protein
METNTTNTSATGRIVAIIVAIVIIAIVALVVYRFTGGSTMVSSTASSTATSTMNMASTTSTSTASTTPAVAAKPTATNYTYAAPASWSTYSNPQYHFAISYPTGMTGEEVRNFVDGSKQSYGVSVTVPALVRVESTRSLEITADTSTTTLCDALTYTLATAAKFGGVTFQHSQYTDNTATDIAYVDEYLGYNKGVCYIAYARLEGPMKNEAGTTIADFDIPTEEQLLTNMMGTFKITQ